MIESVCIGRFDSDDRESLSIALAGQPLPPLSRDYGFDYAPRMVLPHHELPVGAKPMGGHYPSRPPGHHARHRATHRNYHALEPNNEHHHHHSDSPDYEDDFELRDHARHTLVNHPSEGRPKARKNASGSPRLCISCGATKTPYWREAWSSSVLLCNACGLRYSKFKRRCLDCSYVPRKEDKGSRVCTKCSGPWS